MEDRESQVRKEWQAGGESRFDLLDADRFFLVATDVSSVDWLIDLNVSALVRLTYAVVPAFLKRGGAIHQHRLSVRDRSRVANDNVNQRAEDCYATM